MKRPQIEHWTSDAEAAELVRLTAGKVVLEVGAYKGHGTVLMALAGAKVWALDWHRGDEALGPTDTLCAWWSNVRRHHVEDQVVGIIGRSPDLMNTFYPRPQLWFDVVFVDAAHDYESVKADAAAAHQAVDPDGVLIFHDYCSTWPGVVQAVDELRARLRESRGRDGFHLVDSLAVLELSLCDSQ